MAKGSRLVVLQGYNKRAYDFEAGEWLGREGALMVLRIVGEQWQESDFLPAPTTINPGKLGVYLAMTEEWIFASYGNAVAVFKKEEDSWTLSQVLDAHRCSLEGLAAVAERLVTVDRCTSGTRAHVFELTDSGWSQTQHLSQPGTRGVRDERCAANSSVALSESTLAIGSGIPLAASPEAVVHLYHWDGSEFVGSEILMAPEPTPGGRFGCDLAIAGDRVVVAAPLENEGAGAVYVYRQERDGWTLEQRLEPSNTGPDQWFGFDVALSERWLLVGAPRERGSLAGINNFGEPLEAESRPGAAYLFELADGRWIQRYYLKRPSARLRDGFGGGVALDGNNVFVAGPFNVLVWALAD